MSTLYLGTDLEDLAAALTQQVSQGRADLLQPLTIVTPHRYLARWLRLRLARELGAAVNLRIDYLLETVMWRMLAQLDGRKPLPRPLGGDEFRLMILATLLEETAGRDLEDLRGYSAERQDGRGRTFWRRTWQLAGQLAGLLRDYEYHRDDEFIVPWQKGHAAYPGPDGAPGRLEAGQRAMFLRLMGPDGLVQKLGGPAVRTLGQYAAEVMALPTSELRPPEPGPATHVFGMLQVSKLHVEILHWLGQHFDLRFYHLNPLLGRHSASATGRALRKLAQEFREGRLFSEGGLGDELLAAWGRPGAESLLLATKLLDPPGAFQVRFTPARRRRQASTVLARLQDAILGQPGEGRLLQDTSLQIAACPGVVREVETIHNSILHNLVQDPELRLTDIAVLVPDMSRYRPALQAVFDRPPRPIPYNLADYSAAELSVFGRAVVDLLDLALESFTRSRVFAVLLNPCCLARLGVDREQAVAWLDWAESLGVFHGWNDQDKRERGYTVSALYTWQLALRRLRLGRLMDTEDGLITGPAPCYQSVIPFPDLASGDKETLDAFTHAIDGLLPRLVELRAWRASGQDWADRLRRLIDDFLAPPPYRPEEVQVRDALFLSMEQLQAFDDLRGGRADLPLALVREFVRENLDTLKAMSGDYLTGGVTIAAPQPLLPVPFRIVYVLGLGEGRFPGSDARSPLDLRGQQRLPGDILAGEANRLLLLHVLLAARDKIYLTYDCRDLQKDQEKHPCGPLNQLRRHLEEHFLDKEFTIARLPLSSSDPQLLHGETTDGPTDLHVCYAEADRLLAIEQAVADKAISLSPQQEDERQDRLRKALPDFSLAGAERRPAAGPVVVSLRDLRGFLRCPAEGAVRRHLRLDDDEEREFVDDEPFYTDDHWQRFLVIKALERFVEMSVTSSVVDAQQRWPRAFADLHQEWRLRGRTPEGAFGDFDLDRLQRLLRERIEGDKGLASFLRDRGAAVGPVRLGESFTPLGSRTDFPALELQPTLASGVVMEVRLVGNLPLAWRDGKSVHVLVLTTAKAKKASGHNLSLPLLEPALFLMALQAGQVQWPASHNTWLEGRDYHVHIAHAEGMTPYTFRRESLAPSEALSYLTDLCADYLDPSRFDNLPFDLIRQEKELRPPYQTMEEGYVVDRLAYAQKLRLALEEDGEQQVREYYPMKLLEVVDVTVPDDAFDKVRRRFELLYRCLTKPPPKRKGPQRRRGASEPEA